MIVERTRIKFTKSEETGELIGFVSRNSRTRQLRGVCENSSYGKKICVLSGDLKGSIEPGVLYDVELRPMYCKNGYVVTSAARTLFQATFETVIVPKAVYQVKITFGNKVVYFDPKDGRSRSSRTVEGVLKVLDGREDLQDREEVKRRFVGEAQSLLRRMEEDGCAVW